MHGGNRRHVLLFLFPRLGMPNKDSGCRLYARILSMPPQVAAKDDEGHFCRAKNGMPIPGAAIRLGRFCDGLEGPLPDHRLPGSSHYEDVFTALTVRPVRWRTRLRGGIVVAF